MIEKKELRVGNLVDVYEGNQLKQASCAVTEIDFNGINGYHDEGIGGMNYEEYGGEYESVFPIPLNEEWLTRFGFSRDGAYWSHPNLNLHTDKGVTREIILVPNSKYCTELKFVHQLQNLYHSLCGEELELKQETETGK